tara:strand:- start:5049 stop:5321 length:273 start_codon:yes stop_codon:yes gene_type:complete
MAVNYGLGLNNSENAEKIFPQSVTAVTGTGATAIHGCFCIYFYEDTVVSAISGANLTGTFTGETFPAGTYFYGLFSSITLTSGACWCYGA